MAVKTNTKIEIESQPEEDEEDSNVVPLLISEDEAEVLAELKGITSTVRGINRFLEEGLQRENDKRAAPPENE